ncbi:MAG: transporter [Alphaproteobacteria bacterium]|nr:transporter [Alphaproteobacteria bacterium]
MPGLTTRFLVITVLFVTCLMVSNITAVKLIDVNGYLLTGAIVIFPVSYIIGDVLTEVYGFAKARLVVWVGFGANLLAVMTFALVGILPAAGFWEGQAAFDTILAATPRILVASFLAYLVGEFANSYILARLKVISAGRMLWLRTIGSTIVGQGLDSIVFVFVAFWGILSTDVLIGTIAVQAIAKISYEVSATPVTYAVISWLKRSEGIDHYDRETRFNPFAVSRLQD